MDDYDLYQYTLQAILKQQQITKRPICEIITAQYHHESLLKYHQCIKNKDSKTNIEDHVKECKKLLPYFDECNLLSKSNLTLISEK